jgi:DNA-binding MarR family transcriptional regulator
VEGLLRRGLVVRGRSDADGRALALRLTPEGEDLTLRIIPLAQLYERVALSGIPAAQVDQLREMLRKIHENMETLDKRT